MNPAIVGTEAQVPQWWWMAGAIFTSAASPTVVGNACQPHRQMEREQLAGPGWGDGAQPAPARRSTEIIENG